MKRFLTIFLVPFLAAQANYNRGDLSRIKAELEKKRQSAAEMARQTKKLDAEIKDTQGKLVSIGRNITSHETRLRDYDRQLSALEKRERGLSERVSGNSRRMVEIVAMFEIMAAKPIGFLLLSGNRSDKVLQSSLMMRSIVNDMEAVRRQHIEDLSELKRLHSEIAAAKGNITAANSKIKKEREKISSLVKIKRDAHASMNRENRKLVDDITRLARESKTIEEFIKRAEARAAASEKSHQVKKFTGRVPMPVEGRVATHFGEPHIAGVKSKGIYIAPGKGRQVTAPTDGIVAFAGSFYGYKNLLILRGDDGHYIVMGGLDNVYVETGQALVSREPLGTTGSGEFYIEVRQDASPINPARYFRI